MERKNKRKESGKRRWTTKDTEQLDRNGNDIYEKKMLRRCLHFACSDCFTLHCVLHFLPFYHLGNLVGLVNTVWHPPESADACIQAGWIQCSTLSVFSLNLLCTRRHFQS